MAIARVRIAPVERWCDYCISMLRENGLDPKNAAVGDLLSIETRSMISSPCGGKAWIAASSPNLEILGRGNERFSSGYVCEHLLEMD